MSNTLIEGLEINEFLDIVVNNCCNLSSSDSIDCQQCDESKSESFWKSTKNKKRAGKNVPEIYSI